MTTLVPVLTEDQLREKIRTVAEEISRDHENTDLVMIGVLKGAFIFLADLVRELSVPCKVDFIGASSYGNSQTTSGKVNITKDVDLDLEGTHVVLVEDIVDTGLTLNHLVEYMKEKGARSVKICTLLDKYERREKNVKTDYACHTIDSGFIVGYGIDYAEQYRHLPAVYHLES